MGPSWAITVVLGTTAEAPKSVQERVSARAEDCAEVRWCERTSTRHNAEDRAKIEERSVEKVRRSYPRSHAKLEKSNPKTTENRFRSDLGRFEAIRVVQGSATDAPKTAQERPKARQGRPKSALGSAWAPQDAPQNALRPILGRSCGARRRRRIAFATSNPGKSVRNTNFDRFSRVARQRRCAFCTIFYSVLLPSDEVSTERANAAKTSRNTGVLASQNGPESGQDASKSRSGGQGDRQKRSTKGRICAKTKNGRRGAH